MAETRLEGVIDLSADTSGAEADVGRMADRSGDVVGKAFAAGIVNQLAGVGVNNARFISRLGGETVESGSAIASSIGTAGPALGKELLKLKLAVGIVGASMIGIAKTLGNVSGPVAVSLARFDLQMTLLGRKLGDELAPAIADFLGALGGAGNRLVGFAGAVLDPIFKGAGALITGAGNVFDVLTGQFDEKRLADLREEIEGKTFFEKLAITLHELLTVAKDQRDIQKQGNILQNQADDFDDFVELINQQRADDMVEERKRRDLFEARSNKLNISGGGEISIPLAP